MNRQQYLIVNRLAKEFETKMHGELSRTLNPNEKVRVEVTCKIEVTNSKGLEVIVQGRKRESSILKRYIWSKGQRRITVRPANNMEVEALRGFVKTSHQRRIVDQFVENGNAPITLEELGLRPGQQQAMEIMLRKQGLNIDFKQSGMGWQFFLLDKPS